MADMKEGLSAEMMALSAVLDSKVAGVELRFAKAASEDKLQLFARLADVQTHVGERIASVESQVALVQATNTQQSAAVSALQNDVSLIKQTVADIPQLRKVMTRLVMSIIVLAFAVIGAFLTTQVFGSHNGAEAQNVKPPTLQQAQP